MPAGVSIVIVSYNVCGLLRNCLHSIEQQNIETEIIVVDNCSADGSVTMVRQEFPSVKLIANQTNAGFSEANNQGIAACQGQFIFLLNPDTEMKAGSLGTLLDFASAQKELFIVGPQLLNTDGSLQVSAWKEPSPMDMILESVFLHKLFGVSEYPPEQFQTPFQAGMLSGAALLFPRDLYREIGGLDPKLFWMEDADFAYRARRSRANVVYFPSATVVHHSGQSSKKNQSLAITNQLLSKLKYYRKHFGFSTMLYAALFCHLHIVSRIVLFSILSLFREDYMVKFKAYLFALPRFYLFFFTNDQRIT